MNRRPSGRRGLALATSLSTAALYGLTTVALAPSAQALSLAVPDEATASASAELAHVTVLGLPLLDASLADVTVARATGEVSAGDPRATAAATNITTSNDLVSLLGLEEVLLNTLLGNVEQTAPPQNDAPAVDSLVPNLVPLDPLDPVLNVDASTAVAHARFMDDETCLPSMVPVTSSSVSTARFTIRS